MKSTFQDIIFAVCLTLTVAFSVSVRADNDKIGALAYPSCIVKIKGNPLAAAGIVEGVGLGSVIAKNVDGSSVLSLPLPQAASVDEGSNVLPASMVAASCAQYALNIVNQLTTGTVVKVEPDYAYTYTSTYLPNDPGYSGFQKKNFQLTGLEKVCSKSDASKTSRNTIVAVIDTGVDYTHPDLQPNIWRNEGEIPNNGVDDDGNGFVDDIYGYNFVHGNGDPFDDNGHGTHVAGIIAAEANNLEGIVGVATCRQASVKNNSQPSHTRIMAVKFISAYGFGSLSSAIKAIAYAKQMGATIINASWGSSSYSHLLYDAIKGFLDNSTAFVAAAGNSGEKGALFPAAYPEVTGVTAVNTDGDKLAVFANYGSGVDVAAPGVNIISTLPDRTYGQLSGTSMATPYVTGAIALLLDLFGSSVSPQEAVEAIFNTAVDLKGTKYGLINVATAEKLLASGEVGNGNGGTVSGSVKIKRTNGRKRCVAIKYTGDIGANPIELPITIRSLRHACYITKNISEQEINICLPKKYDHRVVVSVQDVNGSQGEKTRAVLRRPPRASSFKRVREQMTNKKRGRRKKGAKGFRRWCEEKEKGYFS